MHSLSVTGSPPTGARPTGIDVVGEAPWGTHFCQLYATREDLEEVLVPYFRAGLEADELCMWVTSPPLGERQAWAALERAVPDLDAHRRRGRIEIVPHTSWYLQGGRFDQDRVLAGWIAKIEEARERGCAGLRLSGNTSWLEQRDWRRFAEYEAAIDRTIGQHPVLVLCTYSLDRCGASEIADVVRNHQFALIKRDGRWELIESHDRRRMREALAAERERLAVTLHSIGEAVIATDLQGRITTLNRVAETLTGWTQAEAAGRPAAEVFRLVAERSAVAAEDPVQRVLRLREPFAGAGHATLLSRDGRRVPVSENAAPIRSGDGAVLGVVLAFRDVTEQRRREEALRESEARIRTRLDRVLSPRAGQLELSEVIDAPALQALLEEFHRLVSIPLAVIDLSGKVLVGVGWQEVCTRFHRVHAETSARCLESDTELASGVPPGEIRLYRCKNNMWDVATPLVIGGRHVGNVFMGQFFFDDEPLDRGFYAAQASRFGFPPAEYLAALDRVPRLARRTVEFAMAFFLRLADMVSRLSFANLSLARTVAEREALTASLGESLERLEEADRRKDEFLAMLSHELRNPLAPLRNAIYLLEHADPASPRAERARAVISRQAEHLTRLVDDLLDATRIAHGKIELRRVPLDLGQLVRRAAEDHAALMQERGIQLEVAVAREPLEVDGDAVRLAQVLGNLLQNAAKFTPAGGRVSLALAASAGAAELRVRDTGEGIAPDLLGLVFEPFVQGAGTLARTAGGLGLGLALVKGLVELHGGTASAASGGAGQGSEFVVRLPARPRAAPAAAVPALRPAGTGRRVLIVDDNTDLARSLADVLELVGHEVDVTFDGPAALERARARRPEVVLCDLGLPGMSGFEVARALRAEHGPGLRLYAVTGYAQAEDLRRTAEAGFDGHVAKPADPEVLARLLEAP